MEAEHGTGVLSMKAPKFDLDDTVICQPTINATPIMAEVNSAEWHTGYGQWLFNKDGESEFWESQVTHRYSQKKEKWIKL